MRTAALSIDEGSRYFICVGSITNVGVIIYLTQRNEKNRIICKLFQLQLELADYVNWFNNRRIQSSLEYQTSVQYRMNTLKKVV